jgi:heme oxygenase
MSNGPASGPSRHPYYRSGDFAMTLAPTAAAAAPPMAPSSRAKRLKALTHDTHERLDDTVSTASSFATRDGYVRFARMQFLFHRDIDALYADDALQTLFPGLAGRRQLPLLRQDLADLAAAVPQPDAAPAFAPGAPVDLPDALGWLYVAEGSRMGATLLRKDAAKLGLSDDFGARHLAPAHEGPAAYWRSFTAALDAVALDAAAEDRVIAGAEAAFARVQAYADDTLR